MTTAEKIARHKLSLLELASNLGNVSKACSMLGYSRQQFYEIRRNFQTFGAAGLLDKIAGARSPHPNRVAEEVEQAILDHSLVHPCHGALRVANELALRVWDTVTALSPKNGLHSRAESAEGASCNGLAGWVETFDHGILGRDGAFPIGA